MRTHHEYVVGREIWAKDYPFYSLIQAAMRQADDQNLRALRNAFPGLWDELQARYNARGGRLEEDKIEQTIKILTVSEDGIAEIDGIQYPRKNVIGWAGHSSERPI